MFKRDEKDKNRRNKSIILHRSICRGRLWEACPGNFVLTRKIKEITAD